MTRVLASDVAAIVGGDHGDPFAILGMHGPDGQGAVEVRVFLPSVDGIDVIDTETGENRGTLDLVHPEGFFAGAVGARARFSYRLRVTAAGVTWEVEDAYRFSPVLGELDLHLLAGGKHLKVYEHLGAHVMERDGVPGVGFAVWAPNARRVSVVGPFNHWDGRRHPMRRHPSCGVWEIFIPGLGAGQLYKFEIKAESGALLPLKADPFARFCERPPATASIVRGPDSYAWEDQEWLAHRMAQGSREAPVAIYEVHLGSWCRRLEDGGRYLTYRELADELVPYVKDLGFTHIELLPISEHPFDGSWGYQPTGLFAPTSRFGTPDDFRAFVDRCHGEGIGVILDWAAGHFPSDPHGLARFDGTALYEHADPRQGVHRDWDTLIYNFGRREVTNFLIANALYWIDCFHIDGLRVDAVASMIYLDYSRAPGEWIPNCFGGRENLEAIDFLRRLNTAVYGRADGAFTIAEESTEWPMVTRPVHLGGLGFGYKWNMGWMHDTLGYMTREPVFRKYHHDALTFGLLYAFSENFVLPLSHDEVVYGKRSLLGKMPGDRWQRFANLRAYFAFMYTMPGKKLVFMGSEFAQEREWNHDVGLDWQLLDDPPHRGVRASLGALNRLYRGEAALHERDCEANGFEWIDCHDSEQSIISYLRRSRDGTRLAVIICNFTPVVRQGYRIGVPKGGFYRELFNSDAAEFGGSGVGNLGGCHANSTPAHGRAYSLTLSVPPLGVLVLAPID